MRSILCGVQYISQPIIAVLLNINKKRKLTEHHTNTNSITFYQNKIKITNGKNKMSWKYNSNHS